MRRAMDAGQRILNIGVKTTNQLRRWCQLKILSFMSNSVSLEEKIMTDQEKNRIVQILTKRIRKDEYIRLSALKSIFMQEGISLALYPASGPKKWIMDNFSEFAIAGNNGYECIRMADDPVAKAWSIIEGEVERNGKILLSAIPGSLSSQGINYKILGKGKRLTEWVQATFPDFRISEDNMWLSNVNDLSTVNAYAFSSDMPIEHTEVELAEIQQMHSIAYMKWWNLNIKKIHVYNGDISEVQAKKAIAHQIARAILGMPNILLDGMREDNPRIAVKTGLTSKDSGTSIYCILIPNPRYGNGERQKFLQSGFCCPADGTEMGAWVSEHIPVEHEEQRASFSMLEEAAVALNTTMADIILVLQGYVDSMSAGKIPENDIGEKINKFEQLTADFRDMYSEVWNKPYPEGMTIKQIEEMASGKNAITQQILKAVEMFGSVANQVHEMLVMYSLVKNASSTPLADKERISSLYSAVADDMDLGVFLSVIAYYKALRDVMATRSMAEDGIVEKIETVSRHFQEIPFKIAAKILVGSESEERAFLDDLEAIEQLINGCRRTFLLASDNVESAVRLASPEELIENNKVVGKDVAYIHNNTCNFCLDNEVVKMLVFSELEDLAIYFDEHKDDLLYSDAGMACLKDGTLPEELTCYGAASRLYAVIGNYGQIAERYYILGLLFDESKSFHALLKLYRNEDNRNGFLRIYNMYSSEQMLDMEEQITYLTVLKDMDPKAVLEYARENCYLWYQLESIDILLSLPEEVLSAEEAEELRARKERFKASENMNQLEAAISRNDFQEIQKIVFQNGRLAEMGYSESEIQRIQGVLADIRMIPEKIMDNYDIGSLIYRYQKNRNCLAEKYMWEGIARNRRIQGNQLMVLLADEKRWKECCKLYENFRFNYSENVTCRFLYMMARICYNPLYAQEYVRGNLQECLSMIATDSLALRETILAQTISANEKIAEFYKQIMELSKFLEDPFAKSVIIMDRSLREFVDPVVAKEAGIPEKYVSTINSIYKADSYPHGMDAYSISCRAYQLFGTYRGIAEKFAKFALPDIKAVRQLWKIYIELEDDLSQLTILQEYSVLREENKERYLDLLFQKEAYLDFIAECAMEKNGWTRELQLFIAELKVVPEPDGISLPPISNLENGQEERAWYASWGSLLLGTLYGYKRQADVEVILFRLFPKWIKEYTSELIRLIVTGNGLADEGMLLSIQKHALDTGHIELALYLYNILKIGELDDRSVLYIQNMLDELPAIPEDVRLVELQKLRIVYGESMRKLDGDIAVLKIQQIMKQEFLSMEEKAQQIGRIMETYPETEDSISDLLICLDNPFICVQQKIYENLIRLTKSDVTETELLMFFYDMGKYREVSENAEMQGVVYRLYIDAMRKGIFPEAIISQMEDSCISFVRQNQSVEGMLCLYYIKTASGEEACARYLLRIMADLPLNSMEEEIGKIVTELLQDTWGHAIQSYFDLFKQLLNDIPIHKIKEYLKFTSNVALAMNEELVEKEIPSGEGENRMLSENDSNALIRQLYGNPEDPEIWRMCISLPLQDNPVAYAKLYYLASIYNSSLCGSCAIYCEKYEQYDLLLEVLLNWANVTTMYGAENCRKYLESHLSENDGYFKNWKGDTRLLDLVKSICDRHKVHNMENHSSLRAMALVAEKCGEPVALNYFLDQYGVEIFGQNCNLGIVLVANLLLDGRFEEAAGILGQLKNVLCAMNYKELVDQLAEKDVEGLKEWSENVENQMMLKLTLPDGNNPSLEQINAITDWGIVSGQVNETVNVINHILAMFTNDYGAYNALFNLCCTDPRTFIPELHKALRGLIRLHPSKPASSFYRRKQHQYAGMLAALDVLCIVNHWTPMISDYDFSKNTGEYYMANAFSDGMTYNSSAVISEIRTSIESSFRNRNERQVELLTEAYLGEITGNWCSILRNAWEQKEDISFEININIGEGIGDVGMSRSIMRVLLEVEKERRSELLSWLQRMIFHGSSEKYSEKYSQLEFVIKFCEQGCLSFLEQQTDLEPLPQILLHPFEDYSYSMKWEKDYFDIAFKMNAEPGLLFALVWMTGALVKHPYFQAQLLKRADAEFKKCNDVFACIFYRSIYELNRGLHLYHEVVGHAANKRELNKMDKLRMREYYEARYRITALFSNDSNVVSYVKKPGFHIWSCLNMVLTLMYSSRADEIFRLSMFMNEKNKKLIMDLITAFHPAVDDKVKEKLIDNRVDEVEKAYFCYVVKYPYNPRNRNGAIESSYALTNPDIKKIYNTAYIQCMRGLEGNAAISGSRPKRILLVGSKVPEEKVFNQKDPMMWNIAEDVTVPEKNMTEEDIPFYAKGLEPLPGGEDVLKILEEHGRIQNFAGTIHSKLELSQKIYQLQLGSNKSMDELNDALLLFGIDYYYVATVEGKQDIANRTLFELVSILKYRHISGAGTEEARRTVQDGLLLLFKSADNLKSLLNYYGEHKSLCQYIRGLIMDTLVGSCVAQVFSVLDNLRNCYASIIQENQEILREELSLNYRKLEEIETNRWMEMKNKVQKLINDEINELDQRPVLQFKVLNSGTQRCYGSLFGEVRNVGKIAAENIIIQVTYNASSSSQYVLKKLSPEGRAVFEVDYSFSSQVESVEYVVNVSFSYSEKTHSSTVCKGVLCFEDIQEPTYPIGRLTQHADGIMFKTDVETGEIYSPEFVGRKNETAMLRNLLEGEEFEDYKSALMYGVRRTGKTSLLNYLEAYIKATSDNIICVKTDCQAIPAYDDIQYVFIDRVIDTVERKMPELKAEDAWTELKNTWGGDFFCADQHPEKLGLFYSDVKTLIGNKGIFLIIDEIDRLFERVEQTQKKNNRNLDSLFGAISEILNSYEYRKAVHLVICGSNWLIRYNLKGDRKNQLFQRFGKQVIEVGKLPENDAKEALYLPYSPYPELTITEEAAEWIWNYAGGLVWHTKLLGEEAIERARRDNRCVVYPSDVRQCLPKVITELWCKQFYEGCESGDERRLVDAMQSLAAKKDAFIHINQLTELTGLSKIEVQKVLYVLKELKIVAAHPINSQLYRFELDIYRRYFRTNPSAFEQVPEEPDIFQIKMTETDLEDMGYTARPVSVKEQMESQADRIQDLDDSEWYDSREQEDENEF